QRVHGDARKSLREGQAEPVAIAGIEDHSVHKPLLDQPLDGLNGPAEAHASCRARIAALHRPPGLASWMKHGHDGIRSRAHVCTSARCISAACFKTSRAFS